MGRLTEAVLRSQEITRVAQEEASRWAHPRIDVEHLLLALLATPGAAGRVLRSLGVTLDRARAAVAEGHAERVAALGVEVPAPSPRPASDPAGIAARWTPRAEAVMRAVDDHRDDLGYLLAVVADPSGSADDLLRALDLEPTRVREAVDRQRATTSPVATPRTPQRRGWDTVAHVGFVPAPREDVWELVRDPARLPERDSTVAAVEPATDGTWIVRLVAGPRGPVGYRLEVVDVVPGRTATWRTSWGPPTGARQEIEFTLAETDGGTTLTAVARWRWPTGPRGLLAALVRPVRRGVMRQRLRATTGAISRAVR